MLKRSSIFFLLVYSLFFSVAVAQADSPLLMEGKSSLYERVITHPGVYRHAALDGSKGEAVPPFSVLYVYERGTGADNTLWLNVSPSTNADAAKRFWLPAAATSPWKQSLALTFSERGGRDPVLFFATEQDLIQVAESADVGAELRALHQQFLQYAEDGTAPEGFPIIAAEPSDEQGAVPQQRFYLMPIFDYSEPFEGTKFLEVASIDPGTSAVEAPARPAEAAPAPVDPAVMDKLPQNLRSAIVFVVDTTVSMRPYIEQSLEVARRVYDAVEGTGHADKVGLGVVAFRSSPEAAPGIEYRTKIISPLRTADERGAFEEALAQVREASVSTHSFNEDSLAGVRAALDGMDWSGYQSRIILLITDAGPLPPDDEYAESRMGAAEIADLARHKHVSIVALHVKSPAGRANHDYAAQQYRELTPLAEGQNGYIALNAATADQGARQFTAAATTLAQRITQMVVDTAMGRTSQRPLDFTVAQSPEERAAQIGDLLGYSMHLEYLGLQTGSRAPSVVHSWIADKDLGRLAQARSTPTVAVTVLLTKDQLSALQRQLELVIDNAERTKKTDARDFFQGILSASAALSRDPAQFAARPDQNLQQLGILGEWLDGLPYRSDVLTMTERTWYSMSVGQQTAFINRLKSRMARYEEYDRDVANWISFGSQHPGDWVYRVPLNMLP